jgi:hypothetical protein
MGKNSLIALFLSGMGVKFVKGNGEKIADCERREPRTNLFHITRFIIGDNVLDMLNICFDFEGKTFKSEYFYA